MIVNEELKEKLKLKTALFDTCILSIIRKNPEKPDVQGFLNMLNEVNFNPAINDLIKLEFLRDANHRDEYLERKEFLQELCEDLSLPIGDNIYLDAMLLSYIYVRHQNKGVDFVDLMNAALLKNYSGKHGLVLVTENHKDYPLSIHDRIGTVVLDLGKKLSVIGFYRINLDKWEKEKQDLYKSEGWNKKNN